MSVELKVTLVGEDPQQQAAFNNPQPTAVPPTPIPQPAPVSSQQPATITPPPVIGPPNQSQTQAAPAQPSSIPVPPLPPAPAQPTATRTSTAVPTPPPLPSWFVQPPPVQGQEQRLIYTLEQLIDAINDLTASRAMQPTANPQSQSHSRNQNHNQQQQNIFDRFSSTVDKKIDELGLAQTNVGNLVSQLTRRAAGVGSRVTRFARGITGTAGTAATRGAATGAARGAAAAAGSSAATGAAGGAAAAGAATIAAPVVAVALAAGAAALSLKMFMNAVEKAANELADLSPDVALGQAQHEMNMELMRLDRAKRIGPDVASLNDARHRLTESMYELQTKIYELILKAAPAIEMGVDMLNVMVRTLDTMIATVNSIYARMTPDPTDDAPAQKALADSLQNLTDAWAEMLNMQQQGNNQMDPFLSELLATDGRLLPPRPPRPPKPGANP